MWGDQEIGQATLELTPFQRIIGVEPSTKMIEQARSNAETAALPAQVEFKQSGAEDLPFLEDGSVDLITSGLQNHHFVNTSWFSEHRYA